MTEAVLAIDQGTTGNTALVIDRAGEVRGRSYAEFEQHYPAPGWVEHDPEEIWRSALDAMVRAIDDSSLGAAAIRAIGITNQRETTVVWEKSTGRPVHRAIVWQSRQTAAICQSLREQGHEALFRDRTGLVLDAYFSGTKVRWILDRNKDLQTRAENGELLFGTIDTWLLWKLTQGRVHATEPTNASRTLLFDIHCLGWSQELTSILDIPEAMLPRVLPSSGIFGETQRHECGSGALPAGIPIAGMAGDQQAALFGQGCWHAGQAKNTYGTGCFLLMNMGNERPACPEGLLTTICCDSQGRAAYALEGSVFIAGAALQWLRDELGILGEAAESERLAASLDDNGGVYMVPAFTGLGAPYWDMDARGAVLGLTRGSGRAHLARAALEAIAYQSRDLFDAMREGSGIELDELRVDGGAAANDFLMQFQADLLGVPVDRPRMLETTALGSAYLAGLAVGLWPGSDALRDIRQQDRLFCSTMAKAERKTLYEGWKRAVARVRSS